MKIGLISDTHLPGAMPEFPPQVATAFLGVDMILHAGDINTSAVLDWLERIAPVLAVDMSPGLTREYDSRVEFRRVLDLDGYAIGLAHDLGLQGMGGEPFPGAIASDFPSDGSLTKALQHFFGRRVDIAIFGHTHHELIEWHQGMLLINPGSATLPRQARRLGTVALLDLAPGGPTARIIHLATVE